MYRIIETFTGARATVIEVLTNGDLFAITDTGLRLVVSPMDVEFIAEA